MAMPYGPPPTTSRMSAVQQALDDLVMMNQTAINFGYEGFPKGQCSGGSTCCSNSVDWFSPVPEAFLTIDAKLHQCDNGPSMYGCVSQLESRPIGDALQMAESTVFDNTNDGTERYLVLLVDGPAACMPDDTGSCDDARTEIRQLAKLPTPVWTYVIPIGQDAEADGCLQNMAVQSGVPGTANSPFAYLARDPMQLNASLNQIGTKAAAPSCLINLQTPPPNPSNVSLYIQNQFVPPLALNGQDGWNFVPPGFQTIQVHGTWCTDNIRKVVLQNDIRVCP